MRWAILGLALAAAGCSGGPEPGGLRRGEVLLQVTAGGRTEVRPDEARITVGVSTTATSAAAASTGNNAAMNRVTAALGQLGITEDDLQTRNITLSRIDYGPERGRYRAENLVEVRVRDLSKAGAAIAAATDAGGNVVAGPMLRVSNPETTDNAAYGAAYAAAEARADAYAKAAGLKVARLIAIRDAGGPPVFVARARDSYGGGVGMVVEQAASVAPPVEAGVDMRLVHIQADFALRR